MRQETTNRGKGVVCATTVATTAGIAALALASPASAVSIEQYIEVPQCQPATSQVCPQVPEVNFTAGNGTSGEFVMVQFTANQNHCADMIAHILLDGYPQFSAPVGPGQTAQRKVFAGGGNHVLGVRAEGIEGGCNTGVVNSWGGTVRIDSVLDPNDLREQRSPFDPPPLEEAEP
jgi:hypothetical protein